MTFNSVISNIARSNTLKQQNEQGLFALSAKNEITTQYQNQRVPSAFTSRLLDTTLSLNAFAADENEREHLEGNSINSTLYQNRQLKNSAFVSSGAATPHHCIRGTLHFLTTKEREAYSLVRMMPVLGDGNCLFR